jgi:hypothetical protein
MGLAHSLKRCPSIGQGVRTEHLKPAGGDDLQRGILGQLTLDDNGVGMTPANHNPVPLPRLKARNRGQQREDDGGEGHEIFGV